MWRKLFSITLFCLLIVSIAFAQTKKVKVVVEKANIYAEASTGSTVIDTVLKGAILNLYGSGEIRENLLNVSFRSEKYEALLTGFIEAPHVELMGIQKTLSKVKTELIKKEEEEPKVAKIKEAEKPKISTKVEKKKKPVSLPEEKVQKRNNFYIKIDYNIGFSESAKSISWTKEIYYEDASFSGNYNIAKGNSFDFGFGFKFSNTIGIEAGVDIASRDLSADYAATIPHPLLFNTGRDAENNSSYTLQENAIYLNLVLFIPFSKFSFDISGGPAYFLTTAELINEIEFSDSYPYETVSISANSTKIKKNIFGFNAGATLNFYIIKNLGLFLSSRYLSGSSDFKPNDDIPGLNLSLGGLKAAVGLKILF